MEDYRKNWMTWIDLETTGLHDEVQILEVAAVVTDEDLDIQATYEAVIHHDSLLWRLPDDTWALRTHTESGLLDEVKKSTKEWFEVERELCSFLEALGKHPLCGNSQHFDRKMLAKNMPRVLDFIHYRHIDVSSFVEACKRWRPELKDEAPNKREIHRAMADLEDAINAMKFFKARLFGG